MLYDETLELHGHQKEYVLRAGDDARITVRLEGDEPPWLHLVLQQMAGLLSLPRGWDSYGAPSVDVTAVAAALKLLAQTMRPQTPPPSVVPTSSGGVQLEWHTRGIDLEIEINRRGKIGASFVDARTAEEWDLEPVADLATLTEAVGTITERG